MRFLPAFHQHDIRLDALDACSDRFALRPMLRPTLPPTEALLAPVSLAWTA